MLSIQPVLANISNVKWNAFPHVWKPAQLVPWKNDDRQVACGVNSRNGYVYCQQGNSWKLVQGKLGQKIKLNRNHACMISYDTSSDLLCSKSVTSGNWVDYERYHLVDFALTDNWVCVVDSSQNVYCTGFWPFSGTDEAGHWLPLIGVQLYTIDIHGSKACGLGQNLQLFCIQEL